MCICLFRTISQLLCFDPVSFALLNSYFRVYLHFEDIIKGRLFNSCLLPLLLTCLGETDERVWVYRVVHLEDVLLIISSLCCERIHEEKHSITK